MMLRFIKARLLLLLLLMLWHGECGGLEGGCRGCAERAKLGEWYVAAVDALLEELHLERSNKDGALGQKGTFLGRIIDSHRGRLNLTKEKYDKLLANLLAVLTWDEATPRMASKVEYLRLKQTLSWRSVSGTAVYRRGGPLSRNLEGRSWARHG